MQLVTSPSPFRPVGLLTPLVEATAGTAAAAVFAASSALRRARTFHPDGAAFTATVSVPGGQDVLPVGAHEAVVRFSRGVGLPERYADVLGLAVRLVDLHGDGAHQDLLLVTSGNGPGARHALVPATSFGHERWSSLLPYAVGADRRRVVFGAGPAEGGAPLGAVRTLDQLRAADGIRFSLDVASPRGPWEPVATLDVGPELAPALADALRFNPANTGGGIEPVGVVQAVRRLAYLGSQAGRSQTDRT